MKDLLSTMGLSSLFLREGISYLLLQNKLTHTLQLYNNSPVVVSLFLWVRSLDTASQRSLLGVLQGHSEVLTKAVFSTGEGSASRLM